MTKIVRVGYFSHYMNHTQRKLIDATLKLLRPLARTLLRYGVSHSEFSELARKAFVEAAFEDFQLEGKKQTVSRVAVLTGLSRKEVLRLKDEREKPVVKEPRPVNRAQRVINGWLTDAAFCQPDGTPRILPLYGEDSSFGALVKRYSGDIKPGAIADELLRIGAVRMVGDTVALATKGYIPVTAIDEKVMIMGDCARDLLETLDHNLNRAETQDPRFQRAVVYHALPHNLIDEFKTFSEQKASALLGELNQWLAARKKAISRYELGTHRAGMGIYYFESHDSTQATNHE